VAVAAERASGVKMWDVGGGSLISPDGVRPSGWYVCLPVILYFFWQQLTLVVLEEGP